MATDTPGRETVGMATEVVPRGHERHDVRLRSVLLVGGGLVAITVAVGVALYVQIETMWHRRQRAFPPPSPVARLLPEAPPEPRLEVAPAAELQALRREEEARLHGYGWVDRDAGIVRIPIERAIELTVAEASR